MPRPSSHPRPDDLLSGSAPLIGQLGGIGVRAHWTMLLVPLALLFLLGPSFEITTALALTIAGTIATTAVVLGHGVAHAWAYRLFGGPPVSVVLHPASVLWHRTHNLPTAAPTILTALAGPASHAGWIVLAVPLRELIGSGVTGQAIDVFIAGNAALAAANLLPFFPMDGGQLLRHLLSMRVTKRRADSWCAALGYGGAVLLGVAGIALAVERNSAHLPWALFLILAGLTTLMASQRLLFSAQFSARPPVPAPPTKHITAVAAPVEYEARQLFAEERPRAKREPPVVSAITYAGEEARRRRLRERVDELLDRINEVGGVAGLTEGERRELTEASSLLRGESSDD